MEPHIYAFTQVLLKSFRFLGQDVFYLLLMSVGYWVGPRRFFRDLGLLICLATLLNVALKYTFKIPRPFGHPSSLVIDPYGMPSGDAQLTVATFLALASFVNKRLFWMLAVFVSCGVCMSRVYLGVHSVADVCVGALMGCLCFGVFKVLQAPHLNSALSTRPFVSSFAILAGLGLYFAFLPSPVLPVATVPGGVLLGFIVSRWLQYLYPLEDLQDSLFFRWALCLPGLAGLFVLRSILKPLCSSSLSYVFVFACIGLYLLYLFPLAVQALLRSLRRAPLSSAQGGAPL